MRFARFALAALLLGLAVVSVRLSHWQMRRLGERKARNARLLRVRALPPVDVAARGLERLPDSLTGIGGFARGRYAPGRSLVLHHRYLSGTPGVEILTPLVLPGDTVAVLVDRGWLPADDGLRAAWRACLDSGEARVAGRLEPLRPSPDRGSPVFLPAGPGGPADTAWLEADPAALAGVLPWRLAPVCLVQAPGPGVGRLPVRSPAEPPGEGPHRGYAIQWLLIASALAASAVYVAVARPGRARNG